jgi:hypothetical protein
MPLISTIARVEKTEHTELRVIAVVRAGIISRTGILTYAAGA